ncbi:ferrochelatase [Lactiplantibacillus fabifermentans]|uniref:Coproporphyrin III ferrochelatase n=2 Tax=Lactiplantibacillus fabifermentans TaxID=483011 RepID=A0A0R2NPV5_9LACO|nr:ferrochelatase [Lactiplantibacillus fabifermentans]ETY74551.1 ferrochelatase [Lactiplantibacillus fabifermentans T30PCM01]KRO27694.1 ferrochelatase [Lactiplantibacillus fabifermentans DSM 21115]
MSKGVLLINLGTPNSLAVADVRTYLHRFLSDPRVIDMPRWQWLPILNLMILPKRPQKSAQLYAKIWSDEYGSPLLHYTQQQTAQLQAKLGADYAVKFAMSYSDPDIATQLTAFETAGITDLTIIPMYPQYSTTTVGSVVDDINRFYYRRAQVPNLHIITDFCEHPAYIQTMATKIKAAWDAGDYDQLLFSYHGIPTSYVKKGDPYLQRCQLTTKLITQALPDIPYTESFQSKFGPQEWLKPATSDVLQQFPAQGIKKVLVIAPSFVADCLETNYELAIENRGYFTESGGTTFTTIPALNADMAFTDVLQQLVQP